MPSGGVRCAGGLAEPSQERVPRLAGADPDPGGHGLRPVSTGDDRVEVQLRDLRKIIGKAGDAQQDAGERRGVHGGTARVPEQDRSGGHAADHLGRVGVGERREPGGSIAEHLRSIW